MLECTLYTCTRVLYTISYRVHVYKINVGVGVRVGVGPVEFQLLHTRLNLTFRCSFTMTSRRTLR